MNVKPFSYLRDFEEIKKWLKEYPDWESAIPKEYLSETGFIAEENGHYLASCWLICTNADIAWIAWTMSNPKTEKFKRREAVDEVLDVAIKEAKKRGYKYLITTSNIPSLVDRYKKHGFEIGDTGVTQLIAKIG